MPSAAAACAANGSMPSPPCQPQAAASARSCGGEKRERVAFVARRRREQGEQALEVRQDEVAQHVLAGFRGVGSERNEQVHAPIIGVAVAPRVGEGRRVASPPA